jgi:hypothetical protein
MEDYMKKTIDPTAEQLKTAGEMIAACIKEKGQRSLDDERVFMEELLSQRLNFLLIVFSIFVAAGFAAKTSLLAAIVFFAGTCICYLMAKIVYRAHIKHHWIMRLFYHQPNPVSGSLPHPITFINEAMKKLPGRENSTTGSVSKLVGRTIPTVCWSFLLVCSLVSVIIASDVLGSFPHRLMAVINGTESTITYTDSSGKAVLRSGRVSYKVHDTTTEMTVIDKSGRVSVLFLPSDRFVSIER